MAALDQHLALLTDLHLPHDLELPRSFYPSLISHICSLPDLALTHLFDSLLHSVAVTRWEQSRILYAAIEQGWNDRIALVKSELGHGWRARRRLSYSLAAALAPLQDSATASPLPKILISSALFASLHHLKKSKDKLWVGSAALLGYSEASCISAWEHYLQQQPAPSSSNANETSPHNLPCWLAAQALPDIDSEKLAPLDIKSFLHITLDGVRSSFFDGHLFDNMNLDLQSTKQGLRWKEDSPSMKLLQNLPKSVLYPQLGRISNAFGKRVEAVSDVAELDHVLEAVKSLESTAQTASESWVQTKWSDVEEETDLHPDTQKHTEPWDVLKTLLFSMTMIHSSLMSLLNSIPARSSPPLPIITELVATTFRTFSELYFITAKFGLGNFKAYEGIWTGLNDHLAKAGSEHARSALLSIEKPWMYKVQQREVERRRLEYLLNATEQLVHTLPDRYLEKHTLPMLRPYLESVQYRDTFEISHSVILALFNRHRKCAFDLAPWYTILLLNSYPDLVSATQLRLAFSTVIRNCSETDDALAWYCVQQIIDTVQSIPTTVFEGTTPSSAQIDSEEHTAERRSQPGERVDELATKQIERLEAAASASTLETAALSLPRGHLLLVLVDQLGSVSLTLLPSLLHELRSLLDSEPSSAGRDALLRILFETLAGDQVMDATKRETSAKWWLENRDGLYNPQSVNV